MNNKQIKEVKKICEAFTLEGLYELISSIDIITSINKSYFDNEVDNRDIIDVVSFVYSHRRRMLENQLPEFVRKKNPDINRIVKVICRHSRICKGTGWAVLQDRVIAKEDFKAPESHFTAICLKCGYMAEDNYNFILF